MAPNLRGSAACGGGLRRTRAALALAALLAASGGGAAEKLGLLAVADPPAGPDADLAELAHQLRAACRDRVGGVEEVSAMRAHLLGQGSNATASELDRAYGGALAVYQNGEFESAARTLRAIVEDLEGLPESDEVYYQWKRALLRLAHASGTIGRDKEAEAAFGKLARIEPTLQPDPDQFSPGFRRRFEEVKAKVRALPRRRLNVVSEGNPGVVYVNGRAMGTSPLTVVLPAGTYRIGGAVGGLRVPTFTVDLELEDRSVVLDFVLAEALRPNAGPGLALAAPDRPYGIVRAGAWLGVDRLVVVSRVAEGQAQFLLGSMYDVRRGALLREGSVRMVAGSVPSVNLAALASFLLTGQSSREVKDRTQDGAREIVPPVAVASPDAPPPAARAQPVPWPPREAAPVEVAAAPAAVAPPAAPAARSPAAPAPEPAAKAPDAAPVPKVPAAATSAAAARVPKGPAAAAPKEPAAVTTPAAPRAEPPKPVAAPAPAVAAPSLAAPAPSARPAPLAPLVDGGRAPPATRPWLRPAAIGAAALAAVLGGVAVQQGLAASRAASDADGLVLPGGALRAGSTRAQYDSLRAKADGSRRNALVLAGTATVSAAAAGTLAWISWDRGPAAGVAVRF